MSSSRASADATYQLDTQLWYRKIFALCQARLISRADAEDATQETFIRAISQLDRLRSPDALGSWLRSIAHHVCVDFIRRNGRSPRTVDAVELIAVEQGISIADKDEEEFLNQLIAELPEPLREVILLHYYEQMTYNELAEWLGIARSTVNERLSKARLQLRRRLIAVEDVT